MLNILKMAWRDLGRNRRRSFFSALALGMGLALLLLMAGVIEDELRSSMTTSIRLQTGHLQVRGAGYDQDKASLAWADLIENPSALAAQIAALPPVSAATPRLFASGIIALGETSVGVRVVGIDPLSKASAPYRDGLVAGAYLTSDDRDGVLIGQALAERYGLKAGDRTTLLVNTSDGDVDSQPFVVRGVYSTRTPAFDGAVVLLPLAKAQAITRAGNHASVLFVLLKDRDQTAAVAAAIKPGALTITTWEKMNALLSDTEQLSQGFMIVLYLIVLAITATVVVNTLVMAVFERTREIGILSALGMRSSQIMAMFFAESGMLALGGIAIGLVLGSLMVAYFSAVGFPITNMAVTGMLLGERLRATLTIRDALTLSVIAFAVTLVAALYPALMAARLEPVDALRGGKQA